MAGALSSGERAVWAAEYVRARACGESVEVAAACAAVTVDELRQVLADPSSVPDVELRREIADMLGTGADR